jgi:hypothetical protein
MVSSTGLVEVDSKLRCPSWIQDYLCELLQHRNPSNQRPKWSREQALMEGPEVDPEKTSDLRSLCTIPRKLGTFSAKITSLVSTISPVL